MSHRRALTFVVVLTVAGCSKQEARVDVTRPPDTAVVVDGRRVDSSHDRARVDAPRVDGARAREAALTDLSPERARDARPPDAPPITKKDFGPGDKLQDLCAWSIDGNGDWKTYCAVSTGSTFLAAVKTVQSTLDFTGYTVIAADVNGDGRQDLCAWRIDGNGDWRTSCALAMGGGTFQVAIKTVQSAIVFNGCTVVAADVNGDGKQDLCAWRVDANADWMSYCALSTGSGAFQPAVKTAQTAIAFTGYSVVVADVSGDGKQDLCAWRVDGSGGWTTYCALSTGSGAFQPAAKTVQWAIDFTGYAVIPTDVSGDGKVDLCAWAVDSAGAWQTHCALSSGSGTFQAAVKTVQSSAISFAGYVVVPTLIDVNGDGKQDLCAWTIDQNTDWVTYCALSTGSGAFQPAVKTTQSSATYTGYMVVPADINGDGKVDLCAWVVDKNTDWLTYCAVSTGSGAFQPAVKTTQSSAVYTGYFVLAGEFG